MNIDQMFKEASAKRIWNDYFDRVDKNVRGLNKAQRDDLLLELQGHLYESYEHGSADNEVENLLDAIELLGSPEDYLRPMIMRELIESGNRTLSPVAIIKGLYYNLFENLRTATLSAIMGVGYLVAMLFIILPALKIIFPNRVGYFVGSDGAFAFGFINDTAGMSELLGYWVIPMSLLAAFLLNFLLARLSKWVLLKK